MMNTGKHHGSSTLLRCGGVVLLACAVFFFVLPAVGGDKKITPGGEGGLVNVPAIARVKPANKTKALVTTSRDNYRDGLVLGLPSRLSECVAVLTIDGQDMIIGAFDGRIQVAGEALHQLKRTQQPEFEVQLVLPPTATRPLMYGPRIIVCFGQASDFDVTIY